ncbi:MAG: ComF family protein, partial [Verrucomicrobiota bacterium]
QICRRGVGEEGTYLCWDCMSDILLIQPPFCRICGDPISGKVDHEYRCHFCSSNPIYLDRARSAGRYDGALRSMVQDFKYRQALWLCDDLVKLLEAGSLAAFDCDSIQFVTAVPLHRLKMRQRGYNQAEVLARALARRLGKPMKKNMLRRIRYADTQTHLTASQRLTNVKGAFHSPERQAWQDAHVLLVDDVMTTGATVNECAKMLKESGIGRVDAITVARG